MKHVFHESHNVRKTVARDAHCPQEIYVKTETNEKPGLEAAKKIRSSELMKTDQKTGIAEGGIIAFSFSFPTVMDFVFARKRDPELFANLAHGTDEERIRAAERLEIIYPQYVTTVRRGDARRKNARKSL